MENKLKIGFLCYSDAWGGLEINTFKLIKWLLERGHEVYVYGKAKTPFAEHVQKTKAYLRVLNGEKSATYWQVIWRLYRFCRADEIKTMLVIISKDIRKAALLKLFLPKPFDIIYQQQMRIGIDKRDFLHTLTYRQLKAWISPLPSLVENTLRRTKVKPSQIQLIPLCIDSNYFKRAGERRSEARKFFKINNSKIVLTNVSRLDPAKNQAVLIRAVARLKEKGFETTALIVGDETKNARWGYKKQLSDLVKVLGLENEVVFFPHLDDVALAFACSDIFVMTSQDETFGMVTIEAMAAGVPVIGAKVGGTAELIQDGYSGLHFKSDDEIDLTSQIIRLLENPDFKQTLTTQAQLTVQTKYDYKPMCSQLEDLIRL